MREAPIHRRPDHVLRHWQIRQLTSLLYVAGQDYRTGEPLSSAPVQFIDTEQQLLLDAAGTVWLIAAGEEFSPGYVDKTDAVVDLIAQRRERRDLTPLTPEQLASLQKLISKNPESLHASKTEET